MVSHEWATAGKGDFLSPFHCWSRSVCLDRKIFHFYLPSVFGCPSLKHEPILPEMILVLIRESLMSPTASGCQSSQIFNKGTFLCFVLLPLLGDGSENGTACGPVAAQAQTTPAGWFSSGVIVFPHTGWESAPLLLPLMKQMEKNLYWYCSKIQTNDKYSTSSTRDFFFWSKKPAVRQKDLEW